MNNRFERIAAISMIRKGKLRWSFVATLALAVLLQSYFVRVLLASEFFFALVFLAVLLIGGPAYLIGAAGASWLERSRQNLEKNSPALNEGSIE